MVTSVLSRFPISKGVAGFVASTRKTLNIHNAYENEHFNRRVLTS